MAKLLLIDPQGASLDYAMRAKDDGHTVKMWIKDTPKTSCIGKGIVDVIRDWKPWARWADLIFLADNTLYLREMDTLRKEGIKVFGPTTASADWELDREIGQEVFRKAGIKTIPYKIFSDYGKAIEYVKKEDKRFVSKPSGDADKALSYCAKSTEDMVYMLQRWKKLGKLKSPFILQEFVPGIEMAVGGWFGPGGFNTGWCENWEFKKLMDGDKGVATGEQGTVIRYTKKSKLADKVLAPLESALEKSGHVGYVDVNCIIDDKGTPWPLEHTMRPGWPTFNIQQALHIGDSVQWTLDLMDGVDSRNWRMDEIAVGVVMSIPDYPYSHITRKEVIGCPLYGITPSIKPNIHLCEMMRGLAPQKAAGAIVDLPCYVSAGDYILVASGTGKDVLEARNMAYRILNRLEMPNSPMWRTDIGRRLAKQLEPLQAMGYASGMVYKSE